MTETGKPIPEVAQDLEINETTLANRVSRARQAGNGRGENEAGKRAAAPDHVKRDLTAEEPDLVWVAI